MKAKTITIIVLLIFVTLSACASRAYESMSPGANLGSSPAEPAFDREETSAESAPSSNGLTIADSTDVDADRVVIKNASIEIIVDDPAEVLDAISRMAEARGGFIVSSNLYRTQTDRGLEIPGAEIVIRVPAEQLVDTLDEIKSLLLDPEKDVRHENITGEDVTSEYTDLQARLSNLEEAEQKLEEIMADARQTEDVLAVYNELNQVTEQIEVLKGRIQYYNEASKLSSVSVQINARESIKELSIGGWQPAGVARNAIQALIDTLQFFANAAIWIGLYFIPVALAILIPLLLIFLLIRYIIRQSKAKRKSTAQNANDQLEENKIDEMRGAKKE